MAVATAGLVVSNGAGAWPGDPDGSYSSCGVRAFDVAPGMSSAVRAVALAADGTVLTAGNAGDRGLVMRLSGGATDATFGTAGKVMPEYSGPARFSAVAPTPSGGAVVAGRKTYGSAVDTAIVRLRANGTSDPAFHGTGRLNLDIGGTDEARAIVSFGDNSVAVAGNAASGGYVVRLTAAGVPDSAWDGDGRRTGLPMDVRAIAARADGSVYVGGSNDVNPGDWRIMRLNADGSVDTSFGGASGLTVNLGGHDAVTALALTPDRQAARDRIRKGREWSRPDDHSAVQRGRHPRPVVHVVPRGIRGERQSGRSDQARRRTCGRRGQLQGRVGQRHRPGATRRRRHAR